MLRPGGGVSLLSPAVTITTAVTGVSGVVADVSGIRDLLLEAIFTYGSGGTTLKVWVQTRVKGGTWRDVANFAFTTASGTKWHKITSSLALAANQATSDAALADNTIVDGFLGDEIKVKYTSTGTYAGGTTIKILASTKC